MDNNFLVPANAKRGTLILNLFRPFDLILLGVGVAISLGILVVIPSTNTFLVALACLPGCICGLLVVPIPNYHNVLTAIQSAITFYSSRRKYIWKGWCLYERFIEESKGKRRF